jgi:N-acyl homoserine lactone hydrolase
MWSFQKPGGIILASDAIYTAEKLNFPGIIYDSLGYTVERIRRIARETNSQVWFGRDSE